MDARIRFVAQPLLRELIEVGCLMYPTIRSSFPLVRARAGRQARGVKP
jgi:hypothetical protein